ncbi:hypothetical protein GOV05_02210 [Candidatus Woesearchaeota archaeon]|nr:hypothetical protein [Candidatus Woesearchaeota archaeon]
MAGIRRIEKEMENTAIKANHLLTVAMHKVPKFISDRDVLNNLEGASKELDKLLKLILTEERYSKHIQGLAEHIKRFTEK